jgi:hypothetical protein
MAISAIQYFPKALAEEVKKQIPLLELAQKGKKGELVPQQIDLEKVEHPFQAGLLYALGAKKSLPQKENDLPSPQERKRAFAAGEVLGSALRSLGTLAGFWVMGNAVNVGASALFGGVGQAVSSGFHQGILAGLKGLGQAFVNAVAHHTEWGNALASLAGGGAFLNMADGAFNMQSGAVNGSEQTISSGKNAALQGLGLLLAVATGYAFLPSLFSFGMMVKNAAQSALASAKKEKEAKASN